MSKSAKKPNPRTSGKTTHNKMKPYVGEKQIGAPKFEADPSDGMGITPLGKLVAKNANRSRKKAARQEGDQEIKKALEEEE